MSANNSASHSAKDDPRRKDIGFDFWFGSVFPACVINKTNQDHELWFSQEQMRAAWIAGAEAQSGPNSEGTITRVEILDHPGKPVAAPCILNGCHLASSPEAGPGSEGFEALFKRTVTDEAVAERMDALRYRFLLSGEGNADCPVTLLTDTAHFGVSIWPLKERIDAAIDEVMASKRDATDSAEGGKG